MTVKIVKKVLVKQILTEKSKARLKNTFQQAKIQLEQECQQLLFEQRKLQNKMAVSKREIADRFQQEIKKRKEKITLIEFKIEQLDLLEIGSEIVEKEVDALVEVKVGTHWKEIMGEQSIVLKDDIVVRIDTE